MSILSVGRSLVARQAFVALVVAALGVYGIWSVRAMEGLTGAAIEPRLLGDMLGGTETGIAIATGVALLVVMAVAAPLGHLLTDRRLVHLAGQLEARATDSTLDLDACRHGDVIGRIARAAVQLEASAHRNAAASAAQKTHASVEREQAIVKRLDLHERLDGFASQLGGEVRRLASTSRRLAEAADVATAAARHASEGSEQIASVSGNAAGDVSSVATASEQLLDSIEEISRQVVQSTSVVRAAVERAVDTNSGMDRLSTAAQKVGDVVSLISRIAAQTNLLALNATIEAARAGEAGRGFAVVAQEVKTLATQTAKATQDITGQIAEMQQATVSSVEAIDKIQRKISEVEHISTIIAAAVHEQGAATQEIARNVRSAAAGTAAMTVHIDQVVRSVGDSTSTAGSVTSLAREFDEIAGGMTRIVESLVSALRAA